MLIWLSEVIDLSDFFKRWDGKKSDDMFTTNQKIRDYLEIGLDCKINVVIMKQIKKYDPEAFEKGFTIEYQQKKYNFMTEEKRKTCLIEGPNGTAGGAAILLRKNVVEIQIKNIDSSFVVQEILRD